MKPFAISCTTCSTRGIGRDEILACFAHAPAAGYRYWGLAGPPLWDLGGARWFDWQTVAAQAEKAGLIGLTEVYGPQFPTASKDEALGAVDEMALMFGLARNLECPLVVITGGSRRPREFLENTLEGIRALLGLVTGDTVRLALEPHFCTALERRSDFEYILGEIGDARLGVTVDTGHFHMAREDWRGIIRDFAPRIFNVHVKDHIQYRSVPLGEGEIDLHGLVEELARINYQGALGVELEVDDPQNLPRYIGESREFLASIVREVTGAEPE